MSARPRRGNVVLGSTPRATRKGASPGRDCHRKLSRRGPSEPPRRRGPCPRHPARFRRDVARRDPSGADPSLVDPLAGAAGRRFRSDTSAQPERDERGGREGPLGGAEGRCVGKGVRGCTNLIEAQGRARAVPRAGQLLDSLLARAIAALTPLLALTDRTCAFWRGLRTRMCPM